MKVLSRVFEEKNVKNYPLPGGKPALWGHSRKAGKQGFFCVMISPLPGRKPAFPEDGREAG